MRLPYAFGGGIAISSEDYDWVVKDAIHGVFLILKLPIDS